MSETSPSSSAENEESGGPEKDRSEAFKLSVVVPMFNEEPGAAECVRRVRKVLDDIGCQREMIFVNDGSHDDTLGVLLNEKESDPSIRVLDLSRNFGHQTAVTAGIDHATGDAVIIIDGDLQDPPEVFPQLIAKWQAGADVVHARRRVRRGVSISSKFLAAVFYRVMSSIASVDIPVDVGDFRLISRRVADRLVDIREHDRYLRGLATWVGYKQDIIEYDREKRFAGTPQYTLRQSVNLSLAAITHFSKTPVRLGFYLGPLCVISALVLLFVMLILKRSMLVWAPPLIAIYFVGGLQLICIAFVGEYVAQVLENTRSRPLYIVQKEY